MHRLYSTLILLLLFIGNICARTPQQAAQIASEFFNQRHLTTSSIQRIQCATHAKQMATPVDLVYTHLQKDNSSPAIYIFNGAVEEGFVLISANDNARAVLGYSDRGNFNPLDIPSNMQVWLQMYAEELAYAELMPQTTQAPLPGTQYPTIEPLLGETQWGQGTPYNNHCPEIDGQRSVAGCVATAIGQIIYKHKYPIKGEGSHSYNIKNYGEVSADFSNATYDWENMLPQYKKNEYTTEQSDAVAQLIFHVGVASNMQYSPTASGSSSAMALEALTRYFGYDKGIVPLLKDYVPESDVLIGIANDLQAGRPVYISATTTNYEGHAFVCDGMESNGYLHINWGWNGTSDGYFSISALNPGQQGTGGSAQNLAFTVDVCTYTNIRPNEGGIAQALLTADALTLRSEHVINRRNNIRYELFILSNSGITNAEGNLGYFVYDTNDQLVEEAEIAHINLGPGYYYQKYPLNKKLSESLADGSYYIVVGHKDMHDNIHPILVQGKGVVKNKISIQGDSIYFYSSQEPQLPDTLSASFTNINGTNTWQMDLYTPNFWESETNDEMLLRCRLNGNSATSVIGTYLLDKTNKETSNSIYLKEAIYAVGNGKECDQYTPNSLQLTIVEEENAALGLHYTMEINFKKYQGFAYINNVTWTQQLDEEYLPYANHIDYIPATALPTIKAKQIAKNHDVANSIEYLISGYVSSMISNSETILQEQEAQFTISDNGDKEESVLCNHILWIEQTPYTYGDEIQNNDQVVILGTLMTENNIPQINGTIYAHQRTGWSAPITDLSLTTDAMKMLASWTSDANYYHVRLYNTKNNKRIADNIINKTSITATMPEKGKYIFWIRPMQDDKQNYAGPAVEKEFVIDGTPADLENNAISQTSTLYDILGNIVSIQHGDATNHLQVQHPGVYILITDHDKQTIFIP